MGIAMMITPQACRRITGAVRALSAPAQERWTKWARAATPIQIRRDVPYEIAEIALEALIAAERAIHEELSREALDEGDQADLLNDLGYIQAIQSTIRNEGVGR